MPPVADAAIPHLVAQVYQSARPDQRAHMLEQLMQPLGVLSLCAIAHGVFASIRFRSGWRPMHIGLDELGRVSASDVVSLVAHAQQVSIEAVDGLSQFLAASPQLAASAAGALLLAALIKRSRATRPREPDELSPE